MTIEEIKIAVCSECGITPDELQSTSQKQRVAVPRHLFFRLINAEHSSLSLKQIAGILEPQKHHSTIISSLMKAGDLISTGDARKNYYNILRSLGYSEEKALKEIQRPAMLKKELRDFSIWSEKNKSRERDVVLDIVAKRTGKKYSSYGEYVNFIKKTLRRYTNGN